MIPVLLEYNPIHDNTRRHVVENSGSGFPKYDYCVISVFPTTWVYKISANHFKSYFIAISKKEYNKLVGGKMKKTRYFISHLFVVLSCISFISATCLAATYYVDNNHTSASDNNPGTQNLPWLTINKAAQTMLPGDTTYIRNGTYNERVVTARSGTSTEGYITFSAYPGEKPAIDGTGVTTGNNGIIIIHSYIKIIGLEVRNWNDNAIWTEQAGFLEVSDCEVHQVSGGIGLSDGTHDFVLNRVEMHHFDLYGFDASHGIGGAACYNGTLNDCVAHTCRDQTQNVDGFALGHGTQNNFVLNRCEVYGVFDGFDISAANTTLNRCSAHDCGNSGFKLWQDNVKLVNCIGYNSSIANVELDWDGESGKTTLQNCTFVNGGDFNVWVENSGDSLDMFNCILAGGDGIGLAFEQMGTSNYQGDYNLFHITSDGRMIAVGYEDEFFLTDVESGSWTTYSNQDSHSVVVHELSEIFVAPASFDFHILSTSSAVDTGVSTNAPNEDFDGDSRPQGAGYDIGADEYSTGSGLDSGYLVTTDLWIRSVINTEEKGPIEAVWKKGGEDTTSRGDRVIWGHFYASPNDVTWGSENNPDLFVKIWFDVSGRVDVNYFHVSVPDIEVYSDYPYNGTADQQGTTTISRRYIRQYYQGGQSNSDENYEDGNPPSGYSPAGNPSGYSTINDLRIGSMINTVEKGSIAAAWRLGGQDTTARGDQVVWGLFYANTSDVTWGSSNNPDLFVKIWFDVGGRVDVNFFHVSVPDIEVYSDLPTDGDYDQKGTTIMDNRYIRHEYWR